MQTPTIVFIGAGNMGSSLIGGLIQNGHPPSHIWATDQDLAKLQSLANQYGIQTSTDNAKAASIADVLVFAIKPQIFAAVATQIAAICQVKKPLILSIAAGIRAASIRAWLNYDAAIVRSMPNTPALIGCGASAMYATSTVTSAQKQLAETILTAVGIAVWVNPENQLDAVTALSGSGPAYFFLFMESLQAAGEKLGLSPETARDLTLQTALGAARMAQSTQTNLATLRQQVTSPGGTTEKGIGVLEDQNLRGLVLSALTAAKERSEELGETS